MEATIEVAGLRQRFGAAQALDGMTFTVLPGQVTGFVGPNGAGKPATESGHSLPPGAVDGPAGDSLGQRWVRCCGHPVRLLMSRGGLVAGI